MRWSGAVRARDGKVCVPAGGRGAPRSAGSGRLELSQIIEPVARYLPRVEEELARQVTGFDIGVHEYVRYALDGRGKRLRPIVVLLSGGACGKVTEHHLNLAAVVEIIHLATLLHDDVIDGATVRRSRPTANFRWGNETSVLLGDCLFARALELALAFPTAEICRKIAAATRTICTGEILQTHERFNFQLSVQEYLRFVEMKTAILFAVSCELGAQLSEAGEREAQALYNYGLAMGTAYQIYDDCVDIFGEEPHAGKSLGSDAGSGKLTLPILLFLRDTGDDGRRCVLALIGDNNAAKRRQLAEVIASNGALARSVELIREHTDRAASHLEALRESVHTRALERLAEFFHQQSLEIGPARLGIA